MEKVQNSIDEKQNGLKYSKNDIIPLDIDTSCPLSQILYYSAHFSALHTIWKWTWTIEKWQIIHSPVNYKMIHSINSKGNHVLISSYSTWSECRVVSEVWVFMLVISEAWVLMCRGAPHFPRWPHAHNWWSSLTGTGWVYLNRVEFPRGLWTTLI